MNTDYDELIEVFAKTTSKKEMFKLFEELFTQREKYDFALRWRLLKDLFEGRTQRDIASSLGISLCKITRGSKILKDSQSQIAELLRERKHGQDTSN
ncbi:MAG: Trp family transcriptional regulator [Sphaerochaetaceae bacterium]|nr:Trp family transcriptional regulator [Sphaerochaetaceae bacterium]